MDTAYVGREYGPDDRLFFFNWNGVCCVGVGVWILRKRRLVCNRTMDGVQRPANGWLVVYTSRALQFAHIDCYPSSTSCL